MPRRRRNPDGTLVVPLSPAQQAVLAKGRDALAAKYSGTVSKESGGALSKETPPAGLGEQRGRRVEKVRVAKASRPVSKEKKRRSAPARSVAKETPPAAKESVARESGRLERWLRET